MKSLIEKSHDFVDFIASTESIGICLRKIPVISAILVLLLQIEMLEACNKFNCHFYFLQNV
jgi:hypothetical protein